MIRLLASVRNVAEALDAAGAGADFIDLKEPRAGALGGLPAATLREIVAVLDVAHPGLPISATIGDYRADDLPRIADRVGVVGECGVDYVKVGVVGADREARCTLLTQLAEWSCAAREQGARWEVVPVFIADGGIDLATVEAACRLSFPALMADTENKAVGNLFDCASEDALAAFVAAARRAGKLAGLSGALRAAHLPRLAALAPDFAGFRGALCDGARTGGLDPGRLRQLRRELAAASVAHSAATLPA